MHRQFYRHEAWKAVMDQATIVIFVIAILIVAAIAWRVSRRR